MRKILFAILALVAAFAAVVVLFPREDARPASVPGSGVRSARPERTPPAAAREDADGTEEEEPGEEPELTEEEKREAEEERLVNEFDDLTDRWQDPAETGKSVSMDDVTAFTKAFKALPADRRDECIHRALNLLPDESVMLLAGVLMDRSVDRDIVEDIFNDILNRGEDVKGPILRAILKDASHPCREEAARILDATDGGTDDLK